MTESSALFNATAMKNASTVLSNASTVLSNASAVLLNASAVPLNKTTVPLNGTTVLDSLDVNELHNLALLWALAAFANYFLLLSSVSSTLRDSKQGINGKTFVRCVAPVYTMLAQSLCWACYGFCSSHANIALFSTMSALVCSVYLCLLARDQPREIRAAHACLMAVLYFCCMGVALMPSVLVDREKTFAFAAIAANTMLILAPVLQAVDVVCTGSWNNFPMMLTLMSLISSAFGAQYALALHDGFFFLPNAVGVFVGLTELGVVGWVAAHDPDGLKGVDSGNEQCPLTSKLPKGRHYAATQSNRSMSAYERWDFSGKSLPCETARGKNNSQDDVIVASPCLRPTRSPFGASWEAEGSDGEADGDSNDGCNASGRGVLRSGPPPPGVGTSAAQACSAQQAAELIWGPLLCRVEHMATQVSQGFIQSQSPPPETHSHPDSFDFLDSESGRAATIDCTL